VMKDKQLGGTKYLRIGLLKLPAGIFLGMTGRATAAVSVRLYSYLLFFFSFTPNHEAIFSAVEKVDKEKGQESRGNANCLTSMPFSSIFHVSDLSIFLLTLLVS